MQISVIIPMYNSESSIKRCLDSILKQTYREDLEIVIVDDGSTDNGRIIVEKIALENSTPSVSFKIISQKNGGVSKARNVGMANSTGEFIALLDSDDEWLPTKLERQMQIIGENPMVDFLGCSRNNETLKILWTEICSLHRATVKELLIKMYPQTSTAIFKRELYEKFGGYNEQMTHSEDGELWVRYCAKSSFYYLPESLVITGGGKPSFGHSGLSANLKAMQKGNEFMLREALRNGLINTRFFLVIYFYSQMKYLRRILITKIR